MDTSSVRRYQLVVEHIKNQIRKGTYRIGEILPGERVLAVGLSVSRPSVKRAIKALEQEGVIECNPSIGSIVKRSVTDKLLVGYVVPDLQDPFHLELIRELDTLLHKHHGALLVRQGGDDSRLENLGITHMVKHHKLYREGHADPLPTVYTGDVPGRVHMIVSDVPSGMAQIYRHLRQLGHRNIAYASPFRGEEDQQYRCLMQLLSEDGLPAPEEWHYQVEPLHHEGCERVLGRIRGAGMRATALVCYNDWLAIAFIKKAREIGVEIPGELSITGYDDLYVSSLLQVPLTTVRFSRKESARKIVEILLKGRTEEYETAVVETRLIVRESTQRPYNA
jgi:DNA-binding LacI/PurR family transcriptional regulator